MIDLTVIIPVYNASKFLERCLDSICVQDGHTISYEVICVNDGSQDGSLNILLQYADKYRQMRVLSFENRGSSSARNSAMEKAEGRYIWFVDADDSIESYSFSKLEPYLSKDYDLVRFGYTKRSEDGAILKISESKQILNPITGEALLDTISGSGLTLWDNIYRRETIVNHGIKFIDRTKNAEDFAFNLQFLALASKNVVIGEHFYNYYINQTSTTHIKDRDHLLALAGDTFTVHSTIAKMLQERMSKSVKRKLDRNVSSFFFFNLLKDPYTRNDVVFFYKKYREKGLIPCALDPHQGLLVNVMRVVLNTHFLFDLALKIYK